MPDKPLFTVIASVFNEQECVTAFYDEETSAFAAVDNPFEIVFVNDGSTGGNLDILKKLVQAGKRVRVIDFTRNFGHEAAMIAGIDLYSGYIWTSHDERFLSRLVRIRWRLAPVSPRTISLSVER